MSLASPVPPGSRRRCTALHCTDGTGRAAAACRPAAQHATVAEEPSAGSTRQLLLRERISGIGLDSGGLGFFFPHTDAMQTCPKRDLRFAEGRRMLLPYLLYHHRLMLRATEWSPRIPPTGTTSSSQSSVGGRVPSWTWTSPSSAAGTGRLLTSLKPSCSDRLLSSGLQLPRQASTPKCSVPSSDHSQPQSHAKHGLFLSSC